MLAVASYGLTLDVSIPLKVERDQMNIEYVPEGIYYVGYFRGQLLRFTEQQYLDALLKGREFPTDSIAPPNVWKGEVVANGFKIDYSPGDTLIVEDHEENYHIRIFRSPNITLVQPYSQEYPLGQALNIAFLPDVGYDFTGTIDVYINGSKLTELVGTYQTSWTPPSVGKYIVFGRFFAIDGRISDTNVSIVDITSPFQNIETTLTVLPIESFLGDTVILTVEAEPLDFVSEVFFNIDGQEVQGVVDPFTVNYTSTQIGLKEVFARIVSTEGKTFTSEIKTFSVIERPIVLNPLLSVSKSDLNIGGSSTVSVVVEDETKVSNVSFLVGDVEIDNDGDPYSQSIVFNSLGEFSVKSVVTATNGLTFESNSEIVTVSEISYVLPPIDFNVDFMTPDFYVQALGDNASRGEGLDKLFDGDVNTKWLHFLNGLYTTTMDFNFGTSVVISGINISTANDASLRDPRSINVINGETGDSFVINGVPSGASRKTSYTILFPAPVDTSVLRLEISTNSYGHSVQMSELSFVY